MNEQEPISPIEDCLTTAAAELLQILGRGYEYDDEISGQRLKLTTGDALIEVAEHFRTGISKNYLCVEGLGRMSLLANDVHRKFSQAQVIDPRG